MRGKLTNTDSEGDPVTDSFRAEVDGAVETFDVASTGTIQATESVMSELIADPEYAVVALDSDSDSDGDTEGDDAPVSVVEAIDDADGDGEAGD
jgi:hypothetical protein